MSLQQRQVVVPYLRPSHQTWAVSPPVGRHSPVTVAINYYSALNSFYHPTLLDLDTVVMMYTARRQDCIPQWFCDKNTSTQAVQFRL